MKVICSVSKKDGTHKTIDLIFENEADSRQIYTAMKELEAGKKSVATVFVDVDGERQLAGIVYLPEIDWYEITLIDLGAVLPLSQFSMILLVYILWIDIDWFKEINVCLSVSVGGSLSAPDQELTRLLHNADQALYQAKEARRNCYRALLSEI